MSIESIIVVTLFTSRGGRISRYGQKLSSAARQGARNAIAGGASGYLNAANKAQQQGASPGREILSGLKGGIKGAAKGGLKGALKGAKEGAGNKGAIPNQDLRASKMGQRISSLADRGGSNSPKAFFNQLKKQGQLNGMKNLSKIQPDLRKHENMSAQAKKQFKKMAKKAIKQGIRQAGRALAAETFGLSVVAAELLIHWRETLIIGISLLLLLFALFDAGTFDPPPDNSTPPTSNDVCNPSSFPPDQDAFGKTSVCTITVTDSGSAQDVTIVDNILPGTELRQAFNNAKVDPATNTVIWDAQQDNLPLNPVNITVSVIIGITTHARNVKVWNTYNISTVGLTGGNTSGSGGGAIPPGGNYNLRTWAVALLNGLGISQSTGAVSAIMHWEQEEGGNWHNSAKYNPLNTTEVMPGHTTATINSDGVKAYDSWQTGLEATVKTLENGRYGPILSALKSGDYAAVGKAVLASPWGTTTW